MPIKTLNRQLVRLPRSAKRLLAVMFDMLLCTFTVWLAWCLRLEHWMPLNVVVGKATLGAWLIGLPVFWYFGLYAAIFRHAGWNAMMSLGKAAAVYGSLYALVFTAIGVVGTPRSVGVIQPLLMFVGLGLSRLAVRLWLGDLYRDLIQRLNAPGVLIYGAGAAGQQLGASLRMMSNQRLVGFVDDDVTLQGRKLDGLPVYAPEQLPRVIDQYKVRDMLLAIPSASAERRKQIVNLLLPYPIHVRTLPGFADLVSRGVSPSDLQELDIEDLLGRDPVAPDENLLARHLGGQTILVTGAGGSIGSELCRQILQWKPRTLLLLEASEFALYQVHQELEALVAELPEGTEVVPLLGSAADAQRVNAVLSAWKPQIIYHAAAYKHVPLVEHNPAQGLRNNVWGTLVCAQAAVLHGVERFVLVSTDKAVRPTNVMGASKRLAEMVLQALAAHKPGTTCFTMVRFGNVLGSSGSVVPLFRRQIDAGGPVTLTHRDMTRYFMTIPEAAQLVIQAGAMARGGDVFVLDMGESVRIYDLACRMVELAGKRVQDERTPWGDIEIKVTGLRPGEKLYEELLIDERAQPTEHSRILKAHEDFLAWPKLRGALEQLAGQMELQDHAGMRESLVQLVSGYRPPNPVVDWVAQAREMVEAGEGGAGGKSVNVIALPQGGMRRA
ncbi:polysaccharide biosynthesis protein [bacterium BD-1]|nr:polysaccharide biosynthesis protein [Ottowia caeni]